MTNGEKMKVVFTDIKMWGESKDTLDYSLGGMIHRVTKSWWNAEYKELTTKTDLGVLDKIRDEIEQRKKNSGGEPNRNLAFNVCLQIIDRYKERSDKE